MANELTTEVAEAGDGRSPGDFALTQISSLCPRVSPVTSLRRLRRHMVSPLRSPPPLRSPVLLFVFSRRLCASAVSVVVRQLPRSINVDANRSLSSVPRIC
jgi:hypothetical protein